MDEKLIYELIFILAAEIPEEDFPALTGWRSTARVKLLGRECPNLHAMSGALTVFVKVFRETPGQAGFPAELSPARITLAEAWRICAAGAGTAAAGVQMITVNASVAQPSRVEPNEIPTAI